MSDAMVDNNSTDPRDKSGDVVILKYAEMLERNVDPMFGLRGTECWAAYIGRTIRLSK